MVKLVLMKLGENLVEAKIITQEQLQQALQQQEKTHDRIGDILLKMGFTTPEAMAPILAQYFHIPFVNLKETYKSISADVIDKVPQELAHRFNIIPIELKSNNTLVIAMYDPLDLVAIDTLRLKTKYKIQRVLASEKDIVDAIEYCYHQLPRLNKHVEAFIDLDEENPKTKKEPANTDDESSFSAGDQPVVQYVKSLIVQAINHRASDVHLKPKQDKTELRFRVDGVLCPIDSPPKAMLAAITTRIKILAGLDIAERRMPQDGRFKINIGKGEVDIRVSCFPTIYGESIVMRLLDTSAPLGGLDHLGFEPHNLSQYRSLLTRPYGLILVTGPTGSGKTTTLYTSLNELKSDDRNIVTLEDPVEYRLSFVQQTQVNPNIGLDFARGLRSILRQDPDIILVGEIRDKETAEIAIHSALTGHLVFSTLHTNDAAGAAIRLINMGIEPFLITSSLLGVIAQRLIRTICPDCKEPYHVNPESFGGLLEKENIHDVYHGKGCPKCLNSGYKGRKGIYEFLMLSEPIKQLILKHSSGEEIRKEAQKAGMQTLYEAGLQKVKQGFTTPEELLRVVHETQE